MKSIIVYVIVESTVCKHYMHYIPYDNSSYNTCNNAGMMIPSNGHWYPLRPTLLCCYLSFLLSVKANVLVD